MNLHKLEFFLAEDTAISIVGFGDFKVEKVSFSDNTIWIDKFKTKGFRFVTEDVWNFQIGGYKVCEKWLRFRETKGGENPQDGHTLTDDQISHFKKIIYAITRTVSIAAEIDKSIESYGGWPDAFIVDSQRSNSWLSA